MALSKARVQLVDPQTGAVIQEVDILTDASGVSYVNDNTVARDIGGIKKGTTFKASSKTSIQDILDKILYPGSVTTISDMTDGTGHIVDHDTTVIVEKFMEVRPFYLNANIEVGDRGSLEVTLKRYNLFDGTETETTKTVSATPGSTYAYQQNVQKITNDTKLQLVINDGVNTTVSPFLYYKFVYPVFVGYCKLNEILEEGNPSTIDLAKASNYFNTLIRNDSPMIEKRVVDISDVKSIAIDNPIYDDVKGNPCVLYPNTWNKVDAILDYNNANIAGSYITSPVGVQPDKSVSSNVQYSLFVCTYSYPVSSSVTKAITYKFTGEGSVDSIGDGTPMLTGFDVIQNVPIDSRYIVDKYTDLTKMLYPYESLIVYVNEEHTYFRYTSESTWEPTNQQTFFSTTGTTPDLSIGGWNDIVFDLKSGYIYQKEQNTSWVTKGQITQGGTVAAWVPAAYKKDDVVVHMDKYWKASQDTEAEPGHNYEWSKISEIVAGTTPASAANTISTVSLLDSGTSAVFPAGTNTDTGRRVVIDKSLSVEGAAADSKKVGTVQSSVPNRAILGQDNILRFKRNGKTLFEVDLSGLIK